MELNRKPMRQEEKILELLVKKASVAIPDNWKEGLLVCLMYDGERGRLSLFPKGKIREGKILGERISDFQFTDLDGAEIIVSLYVDNEGDLFELDVWRNRLRKDVKTF